MTDIENIGNKRAGLSPAQVALLNKRLRGASPETIEALTNEQSAEQQLPAIVPDPAHRYEPFPLTSMQQAYLVGRTGAIELGNIACHVYYEIDAPHLDLARLSMAWERLIQRHDMLRTIILPTGQQQVLKEVPAYHIECSDLRGLDREVVEARLSAIRQRMSHQVMSIDRWPLFELKAARLDDQLTRLYISLDTIIGDAWSFRILVRELFILYRSPESTLEPLEITFRDYVLAEAAFQQSEIYQHSFKYWQDRLSSLPAAPDLPLAKPPSALDRPQFIRYSDEIDKQAWQKLKNQAQRASVTPTGLLLAVYAEILALWSKEPRFTVNVPLFNRLPLHPQVNAIMGEFVSFTLLEIDRSQQESFLNLARRIQKQLWSDMKHQYINGVRILRELARVHQEMPRASMPIVFTSILSLNALEQNASPLDELGKVVYSITQTPQVWLDFQVFEADGALFFNLDAVKDLFPDGLIEDMFVALQAFLQRLLVEEEAWHEVNLQILPSSQCQLLASVNATETPVPEVLLHTLVTEQAKRTPEQLAVISAQRTLTYQELLQCAHQVGHWLRQTGVQQPDALVAVVMEKGWEQVVAVLGTLLSGAAYLPIDPHQPAERLCYMLEHAQVQCVLTQPELDKGIAWPTGIQRLCITENTLAKLDDSALESIQTPDNLAYVIFTSGSTGHPKGAMITHRGIVNAIVATNRHFAVTASDRVLALAALHHDLSIFDLFGVLAAGGTMVIPDAASLRDPAHWSTLLLREKITIWNTVPAMMEMLLEYVADRNELLPASLRLVFLGGDWIPLSIPARLQSAIKNVQVVSVGGPTETTLWNIWYPITTIDPSWKSIPYGKPIANNRYYVLDSTLQQRPVWVPGMLYCAGVGLARGYLHDAEKTKASFIIHPETGERLYRTGDLGRYLPDGNIEFLGRSDFQVKILGQRIELGEIESALSQYPEVQAAVVSAQEDEQKKKSLVAYVVPVSGRTVLVENLQSFLAQRLPAYMIPSVFLFLEQLPLNSNGKVDRRALPSPTSDKQDPSLGKRSAGNTAIAAQISHLVAEVLKQETIDPDTNLLNVGANSIDLVIIVNRLEQEFGLRPKMEELFSLPTINALTHYYEQHLLSEQGTPEQQKTGNRFLASVDLLLRPEERDQFKNRQLGVRQDIAGVQNIELKRPELGEKLRERYLQRRSRRRFSLKPIPLEQFSGFLSCLHQIIVDGKPKYLFASGGGLYPVQTYLHIKPGRIAQVPCGTYYYHPVEHRLVQIVADVELDRNIHVPFTNQPIFDEAAFSIFLIAQLKAIAPMYGERSIHYVTLEAGVIAHLLETVAPTHQIGLCQIGTMDFDQIHHLFALEESHLYVHSLLGGALAEKQEDETTNTATLGTVDKVARMLQKVDQLSQEETRILLNAYLNVDDKKEPQ